MRIDDEKDTIDDNPSLIDELVGVGRICATALIGQIRIMERRNQLKNESNQLLERRNQLEYERNQLLGGMLKTCRIDDYDASEESAQSIMMSGECCVCLVNPADASINHGSTGHASCCYHCALDLDNRNELCPICRMEIDSVVKIYFS